MGLRHVTTAATAPVLLTTTGAKEGSFWVLSPTRAAPLVEELSNGVRLTISGWYHVRSLDGQPMLVYDGPSGAPRQSYITPEIALYITAGGSVHLSTSSTQSHILITPL